MTIIEALVELGNAYLTPYKDRTIEQREITKSGICAGLDKLEIKPIVWAAKLLRNFGKPKGWKYMFKAAPKSGQYYYPIREQYVLRSLITYNSKC